MPSRWSGRESGVVDDAVDSLLVCGRGGAQLAGRVDGLGELRQGGREHAVGRPRRFRTAETVFS